MRRSYKLSDLDCATCAAKMETNIKKLDGIVDASISFMTQRMTITFASNEPHEIDDLLKKVDIAISDVEPDCHRC